MTQTSHLLLKEMGRFLLLVEDSYVFMLEFKSSVLGRKTFCSILTFKKENETYCKGDT